MKYFKMFIEYIFDFFMIHLVIGSIYLNGTYGHTTGDEKFFHLLVPIGGVNKDVFTDYFLKGILPTLIIAIIFLIVRKKFFKKWIYIPLFIISIIFLLIDLDMFKCFSDNINTSNFIKDNYINPNDTNITFNTKKNLIYIYIESMENTYSDIDNGGALKDNLIPNLTKLSYDNISFSNNDKLGGALYLEGSCFTVASMMSQTTGLPLKVNFSKNGIINFQDFYQGVALGDILYENGYDNYIIMGSDSSYGSRDSLFKKHHYNLYDVNTAIRDNYMTKDDIVWWGYGDKDLYNYSKTNLLEISKNNKPFNYTMLTVDTHFEDGYLDSSCSTDYDDHYANVIKCGDKMLYDFVSWIMEQDFYKDTVIILVGDHISMDQDFFDDIDSNYIRTTYNVFINTDINSNNYHNRQFSQLDMFPTTIASIGGNIEGDRLGLGTNLFSDNKTIIETYGYKYVRDELNKRSEFYNDFLAHK